MGSRNKKQRKGVACSMTKFDMFGSPLPGFNLKGQKTMKTNLGALVSLFQITLVILFASVKFIELESRAGYDISSHDQLYLSSRSNPANFSELDFKVAVSFVGYRDQQFKNDSKYVKWITRMVGSRDGHQYEKILPHHKCTEADLESFHEINPL